MKIALIGYGEMGKINQSLAVKRNHGIAMVVDEESIGISAEELATPLAVCDVAIDFSVADAVKRNVEACCLAGIPLVEGTTGWHTEIEEVRGIVNEMDGSFVYGANFSIGANLFYRLADRASELISKFDDYEVFIEEQHHSRKVDAPSGTALKLKSMVENHIDKDFSVASTRAGNIPGTHRVGFDGPADQILLEHTARTREGFVPAQYLPANGLLGKVVFGNLPM